MTVDNDYTDILPSANARVRLRRRQADPSRAWPRSSPVRRWTSCAPAAPWPTGRRGPAARAIPS
ncbi:hypothetical protein ACRAWD_03470 [Caulobacter segnis]